MKRSIFFTLFAISIAMASTASLAAGCTGNACSDVDVYWDGNKYIIENHSNKTVKVTLGAVTYTVRRGGSEVATNPFGGVLKSFVGKVKARYQ